MGTSTTPEAPWGKSRRSRIVHGFVACGTAWLIPRPFPGQPPVPWHTACVDLRRLFGPGGAIVLKNQRCFLCSGLIEAWEDATWLPSLGIHVHTRCYEREMGVEKDRGARER